MSGLYGLNGSLHAKAGAGDELAGLLLEAAHLLGSNGECLLYLVGRSSDDPDLILINEVWTSSEAHDASLQDERVKSLIERAMPLIADLQNPVRFVPAGGKGLQNL